MPLLATQIGLACLCSSIGASIASVVLGPDAEVLLTSMVADWLVILIAGAAIALIRERRPALIADDSGHRAESREVSTEN